MQKDVPVEQVVQAVQPVEPQEAEVPFPLFGIYYYNHHHFEYSHHHNVHRSGDLQRYHHRMDTCRFCDRHPERYCY